MEKKISRIASQLFSERLLAIDPKLVVDAKARDPQLTEARLLCGGVDQKRRFWVGFAGFKDSDNTFCLSAAWTNNGIMPQCIEEFVEGPPFPPSGIADLREQGLLQGKPRTRAIHHDLSLGFVPDNVACLAAAEYMATEAGKNRLQKHQALELTRKRPLSPDVVEADFLGAVKANAGVWAGLMKVKPLTDSEILKLVEPAVDSAIAICSTFGLPFLWARLGAQEVL